MPLPVGVFPVAQRRIRSPMGAAHTAGMQGGFYLFAGLPGVHLVEDVQERGQFAFTVERVHIVIDRNVTHTLAGEIDF